jgi:hypothetical protein
METVEKFARFTRPVLYLVRFIAVFLPGMVHPDEIFQSQEVFAAVSFNYDAVIPWEFNECRSPARSIVPPTFTVGIPYTFLSLLRNTFPGALGSSAWLVLLPRLWLVIVSFAVGMWHTVR